MTREEFLDTVMQTKRSKSLFKTFGADWVKVADAFGGVEKALQEFLKKHERHEQVGEVLLFVMCETLRMAGHQAGMLAVVGVSLQDIMTKEVPERMRAAMALTEGSLRAAGVDTTVLHDWLKAQGAKPAQSSQG